MLTIKIDHMDLESPTTVVFIENPMSQTEAVIRHILADENPQCEACDGNLGHTGNGYEFKPFWVDEVVGMAFHTECLFDGQPWIVS